VHYLPARADPATGSAEHALVNHRPARRRASTHANPPGWQSAGMAVSHDGASVLAVAGRSAVAVEAHGGGNMVGGVEAPGVRE
jgi:hypothetical protein